MRKTVQLAMILGSLASAAVAQGTPTSLEALGEKLFFDVNLSLNRTQACSTCHDPNFGFADPRGMASIGDDGISIGDRNAPTAAYAAFAPDFHISDDGEPVGGQFWDGRALSLEEQAGGPPLNPAEMGMPSKAAVLDRLLEDREYREAFPALFGTDILNDAENAYSAMTQAIAAFERTETFSPFDSKYDRFLRGEVELSDDEELGRLLFFSQQFTNCNMCHQLQRSPIDPMETFSDYRFHNIGVPDNPALREMNGVALGTVDPGLASRSAYAAEANEGRFRTPTLRNVAVTGPYMHNGVFSDLRTVILFYNQYNTRSERRKINPETGQPFGAPMVSDTLALEELTHGPALDDRRIDALVAFLETLTDARYEDMLE